MGRRLIRGLSGAAVFLVSVALLSVRHRGAQETLGYPGLREQILENPEQRTHESPEDAKGGRRTGQKNLQVSSLDKYKTEGNLTLGDVFIAVKTTRRFHQSRMELLLDTWISRAREQVSMWLCGFGLQRVYMARGVYGEAHSQQKQRLGTVLLPFASFSLMLIAVHTER